MRTVWHEIQDWYRRNGYFEAATSMSEIRAAWAHNPDRLLQILKMWRA